MQGAGRSPPEAGRRATVKPAAAALTLVLLLHVPLASAQPAIEVSLQIGEVTHAALGAPLRDLSLSCRLHLVAPEKPRGEAQAHCDDGRLQATRERVPVSANFAARITRSADWALRVDELLSPLLQLDGSMEGRGEALSARLQARVPDLAPWPQILVSLIPQLTGIELQGGGSLHLDLQRQGPSGSADARITLQALGVSEPSGRYATDALGASLRVHGTWSPVIAEANVEVSADAGQMYAEPVFLDSGATPLSARGELRLDRHSGELSAESIRIIQRGVLDLGGRGSRTAAGISAQVMLDLPALGAAFSTYVQPLLAGTRFETLAPAGSASAQLAIQAGEPQALSLRMKDASIEMPSFDAALTGLNGDAAWRAQAPAPASTLRWDGGRIARLELGGGKFAFTAADRDLQLDAPLRLPMAGGALRVNQLELRGVATPAMSARFDAEIEPIDLALLTRALGWPEFGGRLAGKLPELKFQDRELRLGGALRAQAFDGEISVDGLRVIDPLGRVPKVLANLHLRGIDLAQLTGAFSFGRIEGRLDGDVSELRLVNWQPVAFNARLATPPGDRSRKRISQRAIDNISAVGGGPSGVLSRGALRFFEDFAYARIGWSCVLHDGVCHMDGIKPARNGGYVLVEGRLLPRIDVVGYQRVVDWNTFLSQLRSASTSQGVEVR